MSCPLACGMDLEAVLGVTPIHLWVPQNLLCCDDFSKHLEVSNRLRLSLFTFKTEKSFFLFRREESSWDFQKRFRTINLNLHTLLR